MLDPTLLSPTEQYSFPSSSSSSTLSSNQQIDQLPSQQHSTANYTVNADDSHVVNNGHEGRVAKQPSYQSWSPHDKHQYGLPASHSSDKHELEPIAMLEHAASALISPENIRTRSMEGEQRIAPPMLKKKRSHSDETNKPCGVHVQVNEQREPTQEASFSQQAHHQSAAQQFSFLPQRYAEPQQQPSDQFQQHQPSQQFQPQQPSQQFQQQQLPPQQTRAVKEGLSSTTPSLTSTGSEEDDDAVQVTEPTDLDNARRSNSFKSSCHQCKTTRDPSQLLFCTSTAEKGVRKRKCRKKYCLMCLKRCYHGSASISSTNWVCPSCRGNCVCAACARSTFDTSRDGLVNGLEALSILPPTVLQLLGVNAAKLNDLYSLLHSESSPGTLSQSDSGQLNMLSGLISRLQAAGLSGANDQATNAGRAMSLQSNVGQSAMLPNQQLRFPTMPPYQSMFQPFQQQPFQQPLHNGAMGGSDFSLAANVALPPSQAHGGIVNSTFSMMKPEMSAASGDSMYPMPSMMQFPSSSLSLQDLEILSGQNALMQAQLQQQQQGDPNSFAQATQQAQLNLAAAPPRSLLRPQMLSSYPDFFNSPSPQPPMINAVAFNMLQRWSEQQNSSSNGNAGSFARDTSMPALYSSLINNPMINANFQNYPRTAPTTYSTLQQQQIILQQRQQAPNASMQSLPTLKRELDHEIALNHVSLAKLLDNTLPVTHSVSASYSNALLPHAETLTQSRSSQVKRPHTESITDFSSSPSNAQRQRHTSISEVSSSNPEMRSDTVPSHHSSQQSSVTSPSNHHFSSNLFTPSSSSSSLSGDGVATNASPEWHRTGPSPGLSTPSNQWPESNNNNVY